MLNNDGDHCRMEKFENLKKADIYKVEKIDDKEIFNDVESAFEALDFSPLEIDAIWRILSAILHMSNIEIDDSTFEDG